MSCRILATLCFYQQCAFLVQEPAEVVINVSIHGRRTFTVKRVLAGAELGDVVCGRARYDGTDVRRARYAEYCVDEPGVGLQVRALPSAEAPPSPYVNALSARARAYLLLLRQRAEVPVEGSTLWVGRDKEGRAVAVVRLQAGADTDSGDVARASGGGGHPVQRDALSGEISDRPPVPCTISE